MLKFLAVTGFALLLSATAAAAQTITYRFQGDFAPPATGTYAGSFVYDPATDTVLSGTVTMSAGLAMDGVSSLPAVTLPYINKSLVSTREGVRFAQPGTTVERRAFLIETEPYLSQTPSGYFRAFDAACLNAACDDLIIYSNRGRWALAGSFVSPDAVPTLSEWGMILFGVLLAGSTAVLIHRRRALPLA